ncbi:hypothetical protein MTO96_001316 [Rhipicephalus appendiculatus]
MTEIPKDNDPQQAQDPMDTADQDSETQATSVADAEKDPPDKKTQAGPAKEQAPPISTAKPTANQWDLKETLVQHGPRGLDIARGDPIQVPIKVPIVVPIQV